MTATDTDKTVASGAPGRWYRPAVATAGVAGAFTLIVSALLIWNYFDSKVADPLDSDEFRALKAQLKASPRDEALKRQLRERDFQLREKFFWRQRLADRGRYVLVAGLGVFLAAALYAAGLRRRPPAPRPKAREAEQVARAAKLARWSVAVLGVVAAAAALILPIAAGPAGTKREPVGIWPRFRGPGGVGISPYANVPADWDGKTGKGILWKKPVPLPGQNSPVVWDHRVFLTGANENRREVYCFSAHTGKLLWRRPVITLASDLERPDVMEDTGYAAPTAVADGQRVYAVFANGDLACFGFDGAELWVRSLGIPQNAYGHASSLALHEGLLLVQLDQDGSEGADSQLLALNVVNGETAWLALRPVTNSWSSPIVIDTGAGKQVVTCANPWVIAHDPAGGKELWRAKCLGGDVAPSPVYAGGLVFAVNSGAALSAIRPDGRGDVTKSHVVWTLEEGDFPEICSPLTDGRLLWVLAEHGALTCYSAADGKKLYAKQLDGSFTSSPSLVGGRLYLLSEDGSMLVLAAGEQYEQLDRRELGEKVSTCPAFVDGRIYVRGKKHLFCIGAPQK